MPNNLSKIEEIALGLTTGILASFQKPGNEAVAVELYFRTLSHLASNFDNNTKQAISHKS